jgi:hypothetical protein
VVALRIRVEPRGPVVTLGVSHKRPFFFALSNRFPRGSRVRPPARAIAHAGPAPSRGAHVRRVRTRADSRSPPRRFHARGSDVCARFGPSAPRFWDGRDRAPSRGTLRGGRGWERRARDQPRAPGARAMVKEHGGVRHPHQLPPVRLPREPDVHGHAPWCAPARATREPFPAPPPPSRGAQSRAAESAASASASERDPSRPRSRAPRAEPRRATTFSYPGRARLEPSRAARRPDPARRGPLALRRAFVSR